MAPGLNLRRILPAILTAGVVPSIAIGQHVRPIVIELSSAPTTASTERDTKNPVAPPPCCPDYGAKVRDEIRKRWGSRQQESGLTIVAFTIQVDGRSTGITVERSSGHSVLDSAARQAIEASSLPPLPEALRERTTLMARVSFDYKPVPPSPDRHTPLREALAGLHAYAQPIQRGFEFDAKGVDFGPWLRRFVTRVKRDWLVPAADVSKQGHVVVRFNIEKNGVIRDVIIVEPSEVEAFNQSVIAVLRKTSPTEPLPPEYPVDPMTMTATFYFNETPPKQ